MNDIVRYKTHEVKYAETPQSIAQLEMGDVNGWVRLVEYNQLKYPYIVESLAEKKQDPDHWVTYGDTVVIPQEANLMDDINPNELGNQDKEFIMSLALGRDLAMTTNPQEYNKYGTSDALFEMSHNGHGDILTYWGPDNVKQATIARLMTPRGSLILHPEYGSMLHTLFGKATNEQMKLISNEIIRTVLTDTRVTGCSLVDNWIEEDHYTGEFEASVISTDEQFSLVVQNDEANNMIIY